MDTHEVAWAAGFFDGEGYVGVGPTNHELRVGILQVHRAELERFRRAVLYLGSITGPYRVKKEPSRQPIYQYRVTNWRDVQAVIAVLWRFLSEPKRQQAAAALHTWWSSPRQGSSPRTPRPAVPLALREAVDLL